jgi:uncharacterized protein (TIGR02996 family)
VTTRDAFLATIRANPDDDLPRLVYADWLDEQGESGRAAEIRHQIANPHSQLCSIFERADGTHGGWSHVRGFATSFDGTFAEWVEHADRILPESVGLTVRLTDLPAMGSRGFMVGNFRRDTSDFDAFYAGQFVGRIVLPDVSYPRLDADLIPLDLCRRLWPDVANWELPPGISELQRIMGNMLTRAFVDRYTLPGSMLVSPDGYNYSASQHGTGSPTASY